MYVHVFCYLTGVQAVNSTASDIEKLAPQLVSAALRVRQTPKDTSCTEHLGHLRRDWTAQIHALTAMVDGITDFNDFILMTGMFLFNPLNNAANNVNRGFVFTDRICVASRPLHIEIMLPRTAKDRTACTILDLTANTTGSEYMLLVVKQGRFCCCCQFP